MKGAIFFSGQYGSTSQYAQWINEATGLPVHNVKNTNTDPSDFDFLVIGSSVIMYKLPIRKWVEQNMLGIVDKPAILFTVSGAPPGPKLDSWVLDSIPQTLLSQWKHIGLGGRLNVKKVGWWVRLILRIGAWTNTDPAAREHELKGFDFMDKSGIDPIIKLIQQIQSGEIASFKEADPPSATPK